ncbi:MAG: hypothetical protein ABIE25_00020 [Thermoplasmatota archaeon]
MGAVEEQKEATASSALRTRLVEFTILVVASILVLRLIGAPPLLILEVFGLAAILGISAVLLIPEFGGKIRFR